MKKFLFIVICLAALVSVIPLSVSAAEVPDSFSSLLSELDGEIAKYLPRGIYSSDIDEVGEAVAEMSSGEFVFSFLSALTGNALGGALTLLASLVGVIVLSAAFSAFRSSTCSKALGSAVGFCSSCAIFSVIIVIFGDHIRTVALFLERLSTLMLGIIPITGALYAMGGNVATATVSTASLYGFLTFCESFCKDTIVPISILLISLALCSSLMPRLNLKAMSGAIKKCYTFFLGLIMTILLAVLSSQTFLSTAADTVSARAARLVASTVIPIVGGSVGDALRTVASSVGYLKGVCGISSIIFILLLLLPTLVSLLLTRFVFLVAGAVADMLSCDAESRLIGELGSVYGMLCAVCTIVSVLFIFALNIFVRCAVAVG